MNRFLQRMVGLVKKGEGETRPGPWQLPISGGWLSPEAGQFWNWWQMGYDPEYGFDRSAIVEACVAAYSQTVAMCPGDHWRANDKGGRDRVSTSALSRVLRHPNDYQTASDFKLNLVRQLYLTGNAYALGLRNDRYEIDELHLMDPDQSTPVLAYDGSVFYNLHGNEIVERRINYERLVVPERDVLHVRLNTTKRYPKPLVGISPLTSAAADIGVGQAIARQQLNFYMNEARPSAVLSTDLVLDKEQVQSLRDRWNEQTRAMKQGGTPILTAGLKVQPWAQPSGKESAIADMLKLSKENVALVFRIPLQVLGLGATLHSNTEALMRQWIAAGLGFCLNHIEEAFDLLYELRGEPYEYTEFDTTALLRSANKERIEALVRGVQGGVFSPNEARNSEGLDDTEYGDEPRVQQQVVPLSAAAAIRPAKFHQANPLIPAAPGPSSAPPIAPKVYKDDVQREIRKIYAATRLIGRRRDNT